MRVARTWLFSFAFMCLCAKASFACSCVNMSLEEKRRAASVIFTGEVIGSSNSGVIDYAAVTFRVNEAEKAVSSSYLTVLADASISGIYPFEVGGVYRVLANKHKGKLYTGCCSGNTLVRRPPARRTASYYFGDWASFFVEKHGLMTAGLMVSALIVIGIAHRRGKAARLH
jgi:hypothetical protein